MYCPGSDSVATCEQRQYRTMLPSPWIFMPCFQFTNCPTYERLGFLIPALNGSASSTRNKYVPPTPGAGSTKRGNTQARQQVIRRGALFFGRGGGQGRGNKSFYEYELCCPLRLLATVVPNVTMSLTPTPNVRGRIKGTREQPSPGTSYYRTPLPQAPATHTNFENEGTVITSREFISLQFARQGSRQQMSLFALAESLPAFTVVHDDGCE